VLSLGGEVSWPDHVQAGGFLGCLFDFILPPHPPFLPIFYAIHIYPPTPPAKRFRGCDNSTDHALKPPSTLPSLGGSPATYCPGTVQGHV
jgi:hypothetical protein